MMEECLLTAIMMRTDAGHVFHYLEWAHHLTKVVLLALLSDGGALQ